MLAGEPTGAAPNHYGEVQVFSLPNSGLQIAYSTNAFEYLPGDTSPALAPEIPVELTYADLAAGRDPVLEAVIAWTE